MRTLTILSLLLSVGVASTGCATIVNTPQPIANTAKADTLISMRTTISFTPQYRYDASGNIWMYNPTSTKYYKLTLTPIK